MASKMYSYILYIAKSVPNDHLGSSTDPCYIQNCVIMHRVMLDIITCIWVNVKIYQILKEVKREKRMK